MKHATGVLNFVTVNYSLHTEHLYASSYTWLI